MRKYISDKEIDELQKRTKLEYGEFKAVLEFLEKRNMEITISVIIETAAILWGLDFLLDETD
ncbi:MAG: hypothetical protein QQN55_08060 [Nitrosopumilus sp.]